MYQQVVANIDVLAGDRYGNPAQNTAVYFTSNAGVIGSSAKTNAEGSAGPVSLLGGNPLPPGGILTVTVSTAGDDSITRNLVFTGSGNTLLSVPSYPSGNLPALADGGFLLFTFDVKDANNNPIAAGNTISVSASGDGAVLAQLGLSISGSGTSTQTIDTRDTAKVHYQLKVADNQPGAGAGGVFTLTITSTGPNGNASKQLSGFLQAPGVIVGGGGGGTGFTSSIILSSVSATDISVQGTGSGETATLVFQARDSLGQVVDVAHGSMMHFVISAPTLGAILTIDSAQTDASGRSTTLVRSGTRSGVIQVTASVFIPSTGQTVTSLPVRLSINSGLPDQAHFTIGPEKFNFPGLDFNGLTDKVTVQMGDQYGNPVQIGTVAYFTTDHGIIQTTGSTTTPDGFIVKTLFSANPRPQPPYAIGAGNGWSYVTVTTFGSAGQVVTDSIKLLWTGAPIFTKTGGPSGFSIPKGGSVGPYTFTIVDRFNHPMTSGTAISASANAGIVTGNVGVSLPDVIAGGPGITSFSIVLTNADGPTGTNPPVASQLVVTVAHGVYGTFSYILDAGTMQ
jgi:hypothetical protein